MIELERPLLVIDTETTGCWPKTVDRIVQIGTVQVRPSGSTTEWKTLVNPGSPIPPEATEVHGITDEMVADAPLFSGIVPKLTGLLAESDCAGFNVGFDLRFIEAEYARLGERYPFAGRILDVQDVYREFNQRSLGDAFRAYVHEAGLVGGHDALTDAWAAWRVLRGLLERHAELPKTVEELVDRYRKARNTSHVDPEGKLYLRFGKPALNFGQHAGTLLEKADPKYLQWMLRGEFSDTVKDAVRAALQQKEPGY